MSIFFKIFIANHDHFTKIFLLNRLSDKYGNAILAPAKAGLYPQTHRLPQPPRSALFAHAPPAAPPLHQASATHQILLALPACPAHSAATAHHFSSPTAPAPLNRHSRKKNNGTQEHPLVSRYFFLSADNEAYHKPRKHKQTQSYASHGKQSAKLSQQGQAEQIGRKSDNNAERPHCK